LRSYRTAQLKTAFDSHQLFSLGTRIGFFEYLLKTLLPLSKSLLPFTVSRM
jgi:hypothetical protein